MYELALFAGCGGGILGGILRNHTIVGAVEIKKSARQMLLQRQRDGMLPEFPVWDDVSTFRTDNPECEEYIRTLKTVSDELVISGGFPCQDISVAGKGAGIEGERSGLWSEFARIICDIRPRKVLVENSPMLTSRGMGRVLGDLAKMGYDAKWGVLGADDAGHIHRRKRIWILATYSRCKLRETGYSKAIPENKKERPPSTVLNQSGSAGQIHNSHSLCERTQGERSEGIQGLQRLPWGKSLRRVEDFRDRPDIPKPLICRLDDGFSDRVVRLEASGNAQLPAVVDLAWEILND